jgi:hypothetical protein
METVTKKPKRITPTMRAKAKDDVLAALAGAAEDGDREAAHGDADAAVRTFLRAIGHDDVADAYALALKGTWCG